MCLHDFQRRSCVFSKSYSILSDGYDILHLKVNIIQLLVFEETNITIYRCVKGDIDRREAEVNITFHTPTMHLDIWPFKQQILFYYLYRKFLCKHGVDNAAGSKQN